MYNAIQTNALNKIFCQGNLNTFCILFEKVFIADGDTNRSGFFGCPYSVIVSKAKSNALHYLSTVGASSQCY